MVLVGEKNSDPSVISLFELAARRKFITALGPFGAKAVRAPRHRRLGARLSPGYGETGVVYVTERDGGGGQQAGGFSWWGAAARVSDRVGGA